MLKQIPTDEILMRLYWELSQIGAHCIGEKKRWSYKIQSKEELVILACEMLRYDPRLLTIVIVYFLEHWQELNLYLLRKNILEMKTPQVLGVIREFLVTATKDKELRYFLDYLIRDLKPVSPQLFFIGLFPMGSLRQLMMVERSLKSYRKWGFLSTERPSIDIYKKKLIGTYDFKTRQNIIKSILGKNKSISLNNYLEALDHSISRQQALYDLKHFSGLKLVGHGRGAKWKKVA